MASRLKSSPVREGAKALQPLGLVALVGIVGTVTLLGGCGSGSSYSNNTDPSPLIPVPVASGVTPTPTPTPSGSPGTGSPGPSPSGSASPTPTPTPPLDPNNLRLTQALDLIRANAGASVTALALGPDDRWAVAYNIAGATETDPVTFGYYLPADAPEGLSSALMGLKASTPSAQIRSITLGTGNTWLMTYNGTSTAYTDYQEQGIDANMRARLISLRLNQNITVKAAAIGADPATWALVVNQNGYYSQNLPAEMETLLNSYPTNAAITVDDIALGADNTFAVVYNNNQIAGNATALIDFVNNSAGPIRTNNHTINGIGLGLAGSYAVVYNNNQYNSSGTTRSR